MSTPIWTSGEVLASIAATFCNRCGARGACVELNLDNERTKLCVRRCFLELVHAVGTFAGDALRAAMAAGLRGEPPPLPLDCPSPFADGEAIAHRPRPLCKVCGRPPGQGLIGFDRITPACNCAGGGVWS